MCTLLIETVFDAFFKVSHQIDFMNLRRPRGLGWGQVWDSSLSLSPHDLSSQKYFKTISEGGSNGIKSLKEVLYSSLSSFGLVSQSLHYLPV